jgi:hypothetical protein
MILDRDELNVLNELGESLATTDEEPQGRWVQRDVLDALPGRNPVTDHLRALLALGH